MVRKRVPPVWIWIPLAFPGKLEKRRGEGRYAVPIRAEQCAPKSIAEPNFECAFQSPEILIRKVYEYWARTNVLNDLEWPLVKL